VPASDTLHTTQQISKSGLPILEEGFWAEVKVGGEHLRLFSERTPQGVQASVYNANTKNWIAPSESVNDMEEGKQRAEAHAAAYLKRAVNLELPSLEWKKARSA
jgi:hypothetical protein